MNDIMLFSFAADNVFLGKVELDLATLEMTELQAAQPVVFVCRSRAYCAYLFEHFFKNRPARLYVNIDESESVPQVSIYIHVLIDPPEKLDERGRYFIHGIADLWSLPENNLVSRAMYGSTFLASIDDVRELKGNFLQAGCFLASLGVKDVPGFMVLMPDEVQVARTESYYQQATCDFLQFVFRLPQNEW